MLCCGYTLTDFSISIRLTSLAQWQSIDFPSASKATLMNMDKYIVWIHYERLHNHNKAKHNKTVCIFIGIYCIRHRHQVQPPAGSATRLVATGHWRNEHLAPWRTLPRPRPRPRCRALMFSLICAWMNGWVNNREAGDLRCHRTHHDVTVMIHKNCAKSFIIIAWMWSISLCQTS